MTPINVNYRTLVNRRIGSLRIVIDVDKLYWTIGVTAGVGFYLRLDVGPFGFSVMPIRGETEE